MRRIAGGFLGLALCAGFIGCEAGGPPVGTPPEATGAVNPPGFEDMMKKTGGDMGKPGSVKGEVTKDAPKEAPKEAPKAEAKEAAPPK
ncbi:MAG: hypothetical protein SFX72_12790 [Isosphaeraceae bacterium]|nr:hypothetical protein [Isosphaeraceae bacterium]